MTEFITLFSDSAEDISFARAKDDFIVLYASDLSMLSKALSRFGKHNVFIKKSCLSGEIQAFLNKNSCRYKEFQSTDELKKELSPLFSSFPESESVESEPLPSFCELSPAFSSLAGSSVAMQKLRRNILKIAALDISVLILGETGTGKTTVARAIHELSGRRSKPFKSEVLSNSNESVIEARLFGVKKGAFTGAVEAEGIFEEGDGGTVFLDEIGEITPNIQTKLLQVLSEEVVSRVGSNEQIPVDNRMIFATNASLEQKIKKGEFREDLFYRINDFTMKIPPLRERLEDIPQIAEAFFKREKINKKLSHSAVCALQTNIWKGNVRELEKCLKRSALIFCEGNIIEARHIQF
ncbi:sigma-54-dependent transcriptional regulator [Treponema sp.]|uniref:sigma-54-dependent transcriptional regulator n=1 Tax=Treponema sp. TaxID=166 RepID=UPI00388ECAAB